MKSDNELIAEFMGARGKIIDGEYRIDYKQEGMKHFWSIPRYHTSWDWLMPVVDKINNIYSENFPPDFVQRLLAGDKEIIDHHYMDVIALPLASTIEEAHKNVVEFIKWYNENKTTS